MENQSVIGTTKQPSWWKWLVAISCGLTSMTSLYDEMIIVPRAIEVMNKMSLSPSQFAVLASAGMLLSLALSIPIGMATDKVGAKKLIALGYCLNIVFGLSRIWAPNFTVYFICMMFAGCAGGIMNANVAKLMGAWFGINAGRGTGIMIAMAMLGQAIGASTGALWPSLNAAYIGAASICLVSGILFLLIVKDRPTGMEAPKPQPFFTGFGLAIRSRNVWLCGLALAFFMGGNLTNNRFLSAGLTIEYGVDVVKAGLISGMVFYGMLIGSLVWPAVAVKLGRQKPITLTMSLVGGVFVYLNFHIFGGTELAFVTSFISGIFLGGIQPAFMSSPALLKEIPPECRGSAGGLVSIMMMTGAFVLPGYVAGPIAGENYQVFFMVAAAFFFVVAAISAIFPDLIAQNKKS